MKVKAYLRFAVAKRGVKIEASAKPVYDPISTVPGEFLPTVSFAVEFDIPDELFEQAERTVASVNVALNGAKVSGKMLVPEIKKFINEREGEESLKRFAK
jgi:hypothetical protein